MDDHKQTPGTAKDITVVVNGREKLVPKEEVSFWELVKLAFPDASPSEATIYTITYKRGQGNKPEGTLVDGDILKLKEGMIINVTPTNRS